MLLDNLPSCFSRFLSSVEMFLGTSTNLVSKFSIAPFPSSVTRMLSTINFTPANLPLQIRKIGVKLSSDCSHVKSLPSFSVFLTNQNLNEAIRFNMDLIILPSPLRCLFHVNDSTYLYWHIGTHFESTHRNFSSLVSLSKIHGNAWPLVSIVFLRPHLSPH